MLLVFRQILTHMAHTKTEYWDQLTSSTIHIKEKEVELSDNEILIDRALDIKLAEEKPYLWVNPEINNFYDYDNSKELKDIKVKEYKHMGKIEFPIAQ